MCKQVLIGGCCSLPVRGFNRRDGESGSLGWQDAVLLAEVDLARKAENPTSPRSPRFLASEAASARRLPTWPKESSLTRRQRGRRAR